MKISLSNIIESFTVIYAVGLSLCLKTECSVTDFFDVTSECGIGIATEEIAYIELYSRLVGVDFHFEFFTPNLCAKTELFAVENCKFCGRQYEVVVVACKVFINSFADFVRGGEIKYSASHIGTYTGWYEC